MKRFLVVLSILCGLIACSSENEMGFSGAQYSEVEIRAAICEIENQNFKAAYAMLETVLKKEPQNIYALRLLPGVAARQIKDGDKSAENLALIRKAIDAYEQAAENPVFDNERSDINRFIIELYDRIGGAEKLSALRKKAENESLSSDQRAVFYVALAADSYACANDISDAPPVKSIVKRGGTEIYAFRKPKNPADFEKLRKCVATGAELADKALALDPMLESAWSYKANFYAQLARIAEMEGKFALKKQFIKEYNAGREKFRDITRKRSEEQARDYAGRYPDTSKAGSQNISPESFSGAQLPELERELKTYRLEKPLAEIVERVYIPFELITLVAPLSPDNGGASRQSPFDDSKQKSGGWKIFSPEGGFSAYLPANAAVSSSGSSRIYTGSDEWLSFFIVETALPGELPENAQDAALNVLAWTITKYLGSKYIGEGKWNDRFESELTGKSQINARPARFYAYRMISCKEKKEGVMIFVIGRTKSYAIDIRGGGGGESDERIRRFLKSLKLD